MDDEAKPYADRRRARMRRLFGAPEGLAVLTDIGRMVSLAREQLPLDATGRVDEAHRLILMGKRALFLEILEIAGVEIELVAAKGEGRPPQPGAALT